MRTFSQILPTVFSDVPVFLTEDAIIKSRHTDNVILKLNGIPTRTIS